MDFDLAGLVVLALLVWAVIAARRAAQDDDRRYWERDAERRRYQQRDTAPQQRYLQAVDGLPYITTVTSTPYLVHLR